VVRLLRREPDDRCRLELRTNGMRWFETREIHRDGCERYDGYTRVVIDTHLAHIVRAITAPGGKIDGWLAPFLDPSVHACKQHGARSADGSLLGTTVVTGGDLM
jgi:hypothetical protein